MPEPTAVPEIVPAPRWVKVSGAIFAVLVVVVVVVHLAGGGLGRHMHAMQAPARAAEPAAPQP